ncbi:glycoside hydrolase family 13 protein [Auriculariales sp. MPI-PUGE-AT-0066]|nr:glycoside hydrolase family 13 protein [Auriculariales sp. MPI-PUGE-AT-0066]
MSIIHEKVRSGHLPTAGSLNASSRPSRISIPNFSDVRVPGTQPPSIKTPKTPKTPADEAIDFFSSDSQPGEQPIQVYLLELDYDGGPSPGKDYIRLPPPLRPYIVRVSLKAGTPATRNGVFKTNFPLDGGAFERLTFCERELPTTFSKAITIDLPISHAGAFAYWVEYDEEPVGDAPPNRVKGREGYFNVDPALAVKRRAPVLDKNGRPLSVSQGGGVLTDTDSHITLDGITMLTLVSKWMGPMSGWRTHLQEASQRGYNMIHFTPMQQRGDSLSPYSIFNQRAYDRGLFDDNWKGSDEEGVALVKNMLKEARNDFGLMSLTDVVLNHTAQNSDWLLDHPEAGYSPFNSPHLIPAFELDDCFVKFASNLSSRGLPTSIDSERDLETLMDALRQDVGKLNMWQFYVLDPVKGREEVKAALEANNVHAWSGPDVVGHSFSDIANTLRSQGLIRNLDIMGPRYNRSIDPAVSAGVLKAAYPGVNNNDTLADNWVQIANVINVPLYEEWNTDTDIALNQVRDRAKYNRLDENGPKFGPITAKLGIADQYFSRIPRNERTAKFDEHELAVANNGWIWNADPLINFATSASKAYLQRQVIAWGDCVKLRYGAGPQDNPWLWQWMTDYVGELAQTFDGFRLDNCHSTPLHVGVAMLDAARSINPNLYVCAELFTGSAEKDLYFVSRLGINSLIREAYNGGSPKEFSGLLYNFGLNKPIGSMDEACLTIAGELPPPPHILGPTRPARITPLMGSKPHALVFDLTHDNEAPLEKRSAEDALATGALVAFADCAVASNKGFDDLYPKLLNLVSDNRLYETAGSEEYRGTSRVKRVLNLLHSEMMLEGYNEAYVHQEGDYIMMQRVSPITHKGYLLIAHTAFGWTKGKKDRGDIAPFRLNRTRAEFVLAASLDVTSYEIPADPKTIRGLPSQLIDLELISPSHTSDANGDYAEITVPDHFPPGSIAVFRTHMPDTDPGLETVCRAHADEMVVELDLVDLNVLLFRAESEERDVTNGQEGPYRVPDMAELTYCGLEGWMPALNWIMSHNDLGHPLCNHLRSGTWALDYVHVRLERQLGLFPRLAGPIKWLKERFDKIKSTVPDFLRPKYFAIVVYAAYQAATKAALEQQSEFVTNGHEFTKALALTALQMHGTVISASIDPRKAVPSLAAGLPHFARSWGRTWGRDCAISLRGLFLTTGMFEPARKHILALMSLVQHGLIPNLIDSCRTPRYNSRDSPWWMLQNIQDYTLMAPNGVAILNEQVKRRFPKDESWVPWDDARAYSETSTLAELIHEVLERHARGIHFREHNAGPNLDEHMRDEGFNIDIEVDWNTGFVHGGNAFNCGTWMDKNGSSSKAGNDGLPGSPRDGAPVEIQGLLKSTVRWLARLSSSGQFPVNGVNAIVDGQEKFVSFQDWNDLLQNNFERCFYIPKSSDAAQDAQHEVTTGYVNRRGIYKDVRGSGAGREYADYRLRPNFSVAMTVAPELFDPDHALGALHIADNVLRGPMGMKTLDPSDLMYRGDYDNANDTSDPTVAQGWNYHNGPEWGWPLGFFLRAYLHFDTRVGRGRNDPNETLHYLHKLLLRPREHIATDSWAGLPELCNSNGSFCHDSCPTQAWSSSTLLDFLQEVQLFEY